MELNYIYKAKVVRWVDGDTVDLDVDLGFRFHANMRFRLLGLDTPERGQLNYVEASNLSKSLAPVDKTVLIQTVKDEKADKYGRYLVTIESDGVSVNASLLEQHLAKPYDGGHKD
jgi:micrococcal nuclease